MGFGSKNESHSSSTSRTPQAESSRTQRGASCASQYTSVNYCTGCLFVNESSSKSLLFYKALKGVVPGYVSDLFIWRTWNLQILHVLQKRLTQGFQSHKAKHLLVTGTTLLTCGTSFLDAWGLLSQFKLHYIPSLILTVLLKPLVFFLAIPIKCISVFML